MPAKTHRCTQKDKSSSDTHSHNHDAGLQPIISSSFSRQIQFLSKTYVSWLKEPTKTGEICHILQGWTQYWVLLCLCLAFRSLSFLSSDLCITWWHHTSISAFSLSFPFFTMWLSFHVSLERQTHYSWWAMKSLLWLHSCFPFTIHTYWLKLCITNVSMMKSWQRAFCSHPVEFLKSLSWAGFLYIHVKWLHTPSSAHMLVCLRRMFF